MEQLIESIGLIAVLGPILGLLLTNLVQLVKLVDRQVAAINIPDGVYFYVLLVVGAGANVAVFIAPQVGLDLGIISDALADFNGIVEFLGLFATSAVAAWLFRKLNNLSKSEQPQP